MSHLAIAGIEKVYPGRADKALGGVSVEVGEREVVALLGRSGSGKSTLLRCINRLVEPDAGSITFEGVDITKLDPAALRAMRQRIGMVFQEFNLVNRLSVLENVLCGRVASVSLARCWFRIFPKRDIERAEHLLEQVGLAKLRYKRADSLSGGQRQRVGIARALMQEPRLLLADEPTASLDPQTGCEILEVICELARTNHLPVLISIHDVALARRYVERIVALKAGLKIFDGPADSMDLESIYRHSDVRPASAAPELGPLAMEPAR